MAKLVQTLPEFGQDVAEILQHVIKFGIFLAMAIKTLANTCYGKCFELGWVQKDSEDAKNAHVSCFPDWIPNVQTCASLVDLKRCCITNISYYFIAKIG